MNEREPIDSINAQQEHFSTEGMPARQPSPELQRLYSAEPKTPAQQQRQQLLRTLDVLSEQRLASQDAIDKIRQAVIDDESRALKDPHEAIGNAESSEPLLSLYQDRLPYKDAAAEILAGTTLLRESASKELATTGNASAVTPYQERTVMTAVVDGMVDTIKDPWVHVTSVAGTIATVTGASAAYGVEATPLFTGATAAVLYGIHLSGKVAGKIRNHFQNK